MALPSSTRPACRPARRSPGRTPLALTAAVLAAAALGACRSDHVNTTGSIHPDDVRTRHPFILAEGARTLDVFPTGSGALDPRQAADVEAFLLEYRRYGRGALTVDLPRGVGPDLGAAVERTGAAIRRMSAENGLPPGTLVVSGYAVADPALAAPLRLSFQRTEARVASQCGLWPQDLGASDFLVDQSNVTYWNLGCATRSNIAAQTDDPTDLVRGREPGQIDTVRRTKVINTLRDGNDPSTTWRQDGKASVKDSIGR